MRQLREAARGCGLNLEGILSVEKIQAPDRPFLAYLKRGQHGHFVVIRPVGRLGRMVQLFDNDREAEVFDLSELTSSPEWTGLALRPQPPGLVVQARARVRFLGLMCRIHLGPSPHPPLFAAEPGES